MTSTVKVKAHNDPVLVRCMDLQKDGSSIVASQHIIVPEDGHVEFHCWKDRRVECIDVPPGTTLESLSKLSIVYED